MEFVPPPPTLDLDLAAAEKLARAKFEELREQRGQLTDSDEKIVSLKRQISLPKAPNSTTYAWLLKVPAEDPVFIKLGVLPTYPNISSFEPVSTETRFLNATRFEPSGPFEYKVPAGTHRIEIEWHRPLGKKYFEFTTKLNGKLIFRSEYQREDVLGQNTSMTGTESQMEFTAPKKLPILLALEPHFDLISARTKESAEPRAYKILVWLSRESTDFATPPKVLE